jgi:hypothetical protein
MLLSAAPGAIPAEGDTLLFVFLKLLSPFHPLFDCPQLPLCPLIWSNEVPREMEGTLPSVVIPLPPPPPIPSIAFGVVGSLIKSALEIELDLDAEPKLGFLK